MRNLYRPDRDQRHRRGPGLLAGILLLGGVLVGCDAGTSFGAGAGRADWWVDRETLPLPADTRLIHGFLQENACASGSSPEGRILGPTIEYRPDAIVVTFQVRHTGGVATCPSNPPFPVTIELTEALGARSLLDGGVTPARDATIDPTIRLAPDEDCGPLVGTGDAKLACLALVSATLGEEYASYADVRVAPAGADCPGDTCTEASAIEARTWTVEASDLTGASFAWACTYRDEVATCSPR